MKNSKLSLVFVCIVITIAFSQNSFEIKGTVKNQAKFSVDSLDVVLKLAGYSAKTDTSGTFSIKGATPIVLNDLQKSSIPKFNGSHFIIPVLSGSQQVSIEVFNLKGSRIASIHDRKLSEGEHAIPFLGNQANIISQSVLIAVVRSGTQLVKFRLVKMGDQRFMARDFTTIANTNGSTEATRAVSPRAIDSLRFIRKLVVEGQNKEFIEYTIPVTKLVETFEVILDLIPYEAIEWGKTQVGRGAETVGQELKEQNIYPYELYRYSGGSAWCSEFYSYILRIGGCPLGTDGGSATRPNWLNTGWNTLITWFQKNAKYVEKSQIDAQNYRPNPGDFIQMAEHTTMVRYLVGDIVYTLGGNEGNKVQLANRGNYKTFSSLNGYGRRSGITGNSYKSISE